jgi:hypothetical protein
MGVRANKGNCKKCGRSREVAGQMSHSGQCADCARAAVEANIQGLHFHTGPAFSKWRAGMAASVGAMLVDKADETR